MESARGRGSNARGYTRAASDLPTTASGQDRFASSSAAPKRTRKRRSKNSSGKSRSASPQRALVNGQRGAPTHAVAEDYRITLTRALMELREDMSARTLQFPSTLTNTERKFVHDISRKFGLVSKSSGNGENRSITVRKPDAMRKSASLDPELLPSLNLGPRGKESLRNFFVRFPPTRDEDLESHETGASLALGGNDAEIQARLEDLGIVASDKTFGGPVRPRFVRPMNLQKRREYHGRAQKVKQNHAEFARMMQARLKLPAYRHHERVVETVKHSPVTIISGETGCGTLLLSLSLRQCHIYSLHTSHCIEIKFYIFFLLITHTGKSTQIPQFLLDALPECRICVTQPRRISAISIAERVSEEQCQGDPGGLIGYQVRLESAMSNNTQLLFMTPGILLRKMHSSPQLTEFTHIIIDEIHERDRFQEFLLVVLRDLIAVRPDIRIVLMSATLQSKELVEYFEQVGIQPAVIEMEGRTFPVKEFFLEQVLEMTGFIDPSSKYDLGQHLEAEMAKVTGQPLIGDKIANVSLQCAMCGKKGFTDPLALGEHVALCDGVLHEDSEQSELDGLNGEFQKFVDVHGNFNLSDLGIDEVAANSSGSERSSTSSGKKKRGRLLKQSSSLTKASAPAVATNATMHFNDILDKMNSPPTVAITPKEQALLEKYQTKNDDEDIDIDLLLELIRYISKLPEQDGGILVFLPGWYEISEVHRILESTAPFADSSRYLVLPLHSGIASKDQRRVMRPAPRGVRKIVLSTNIAETSVTINDIVFVVDTGRAKEKNYDPHLNTSTLQSTWVSRASAKQRKGRAGRVRPGFCFHLFSRSRHESMRPFMDSELLRTPLVSTVQPSFCWIDHSFFGWYLMFFNFFRRKCVS
jgi:HrpA-like RNA helicase